MFESWWKWHRPQIKLSPLLDLLILNKYTNIFMKAGFTNEAVKSFMSFMCFCNTKNIYIYTYPVGKKKLGQATPSQQAIACPMDLTKFGPHERGHTDPNPKCPTQPPCIPQNEGIVSRLLYQHRTPLHQAPMQGVNSNQEMEMHTPTVW